MRHIPKVAVLLAAVLVPLAATSTTPVRHSIAASPGETLHLDLNTGATIVVSGWDEKRVAVDVEMRGRNADDAVVTVTRAKDGVRIHSGYEGDSRSHQTNIRLGIRVPRRFDMQIQSAGGGITLLDLEGTFEGSTGGGAIKLDRLRGVADLTTGGGEIDVRDSDLDGTVTTGGGPVTLTRVRGGLEGSSGSGPVTSMRDNTLHIQRPGGDVRLGRTDTDVVVSTGGGDIELGPVDGSVRASTGGGDIEVTVTANDADVDLATGSGRITVTLPRDLDARFELESAYTDSFGRKTRIDSDWTLQQSEPKGWDHNRGAPRRYVRATGVVGRGRGLIRVRAINGDVTVRRLAPTAQ